MSNSAREYSVHITCFAKAAFANNRQIFSADAQMEYIQTSIHLHGFTVAHDFPTKRGNEVKVVSLTSSMLSFAELSLLICRFCLFVYR